MQRSMATSVGAVDQAWWQRKPVRQGWFTPAMLEIAAVAVAALAVIFNPLLAIVNGHVHTLGGGIVAMIQAMLTFGALLIGGFSRGTVTRWMVVAWALGVVFVALSLMRGDLAVKNLGDVLIIPAFIALGQRIRPAVLVRLVIGLQIAITVVGVLELLFPSLYATVFKVTEYYVSTRGFDEEAFWAGNDLFLSSQRPGGRLLLDGFGFHRGSSLFLEPVSLGNWVIVVAIFLAGFWRDLSWRARAFLAISNLILLVVCDGRLALGVCVVLALYAPFARRIPSSLSFFYLPGVLLLLTVLIAAGYLATEGDTLPGRLNVGYHSLVGLDLADMMAFGSQPLNADAGWVYFIQTQSLLIGIAMWGLITLTHIGEDDGARMYKHGLVLFLAMCLPISYSVLSIKTMSILWCGYGCLFAHALSRTSREPRVEEKARPARMTVY